MAMTKTQVIALLKENRNERGVANWKKHCAKSKLKSFGIGLTQLRKLAKQIGRDHKLAWELWKSDTYDVKVIGLLIDDPKQLSREQAEEQVEGLNAGMFSHVFASCDATLAKTPFAFELARDGGQLGLVVDGVAVLIASGCQRRNARRGVRGEFEGDGERGGTVLTAAARLGTVGETQGIGVLAAGQN